MSTTKSLVPTVASRWNVSVCHLRPYGYPSCHLSNDRPTYSCSFTKSQGTLHAAVPLSKPSKSLKLIVRVNSLVPIRMTLGRSSAETAMSRRRARWCVPVMRRVQVVRATSMWAAAYPPPISHYTTSPILRSSSARRVNPVKTPISTSLPRCAMMLERIRRTAM